MLSSGSRQARIYLRKCRAHIVVRYARDCESGARAGGLSAQLLCPVDPRICVAISSVVCRQFERQYVFVAATLPSEGKKSIASSLEKMFPGLTWLAGRRLHQGLSTVTWAWRQTTQDSWKSILQVRHSALHAMSALLVNMCRP